MGMTMMTAANLSDTTRCFLWLEVVRCANNLYNITVDKNMKIMPFEAFTCNKPKLHPHLIQFGRIRYVKIHKKIKRNWESQACKMIVIGYTNNKPQDTYRIYNPKTQQIVKSRDVKWADWRDPDLTNTPKAKA